MIEVFAGLIAAMLHVISGPDHLAAVTPLAIESKNKTWKIGFAWGIGHTAGVFIIGLIFILFREFIPIDKISESSEIIVGVILVFLGIWALWKIFGKKHAHQHVHDDHSHGRISRSNNVKAAFSVGIIHGLAGFSHLVAILPTLALPTKIAAISYLGGFAFGTIVTMMSYSYVLGLIARRSDNFGNGKYYKGLRVTGGLLAIVVGVVWITLSMR